MAYIMVLEWGPTLSTPDGLVVQVAAQKIVAGTAAAIVIFLSIEADRVASAAESVA
jgi:hypothetical protein